MFINKSQTDQHQLPTLDLKQLNSSLFLNSSPFFINQLKHGFFQRTFSENSFWSFFAVLNVFFLSESQNFLPRLCSILRVVFVPSTAQNPLIFYCSKTYNNNSKRKTILVTWQLKTGRLFSHVRYQDFNFRAAWFNPCAVEGSKNALGYQPHNSLNSVSQ